MPENLTYKDNVKEVNKQLSQAGIALQEAGAEAINRAAYFVLAKYRLELREKTNYLRNRTFTLNSIRVYTAHARRSDGKTLRQMEDINAKVGIPQMSGGREHYLALLEVGAKKKGIPGLNNRVAIPLDTARGGDRSKAVQGVYRLVKNSRYKGEIDLSKWASNRDQQYAIMQSMNRRGKLYTINKKQEISRHGYWMVNYGGGKSYLFSVGKKEAKMVRDTSYSSPRAVKKPMFQSSLKDINQERLMKYYLDEAKRLIDEKVKASAPGK